MTFFLIFAVSLKNPRRSDKSHNNLYNLLGILRKAPQPLFLISDQIFLFSNATPYY